MRYLLLSVLVVCMIGIMVPSVFGDEDSVEMEKAVKLLLPDTYTLHDVSYVSTSTPNSGEIPYIEALNVFVKEEEVYAAITIWKFLPAQDVPELANKMADAWGLYAEVDLTPDSSCVYGVLRDTPAFLCSKNDIIVYAGGTGINFKKYTKEVLNNIKGPISFDTSKISFMPIDPLYIIIGVVAIGGTVVGVIVAIKRGSKTPKPVKEEPKEATSAFCESCGNTLKPEAKFCGKCGTARS